MSKVRNGNVPVEHRHPKRGFTAQERQQIWKRDKGRCQECGKSADPKNWHADHIVSHAKGGVSSVDNGQVTHPLCNRKKSDNESSGYTPPSASDALETINTGLKLVDMFVKLLIKREERKHRSPQ